VSSTQSGGTNDSERLLSALAEQLKLPLVQIAHGLESGEFQTSALADNAKLAIKLIDSFLLSNSHPKQEYLPLEPVSLSAIFQDVAHQLSGHAKRYDCQIELSIAGKYQPVMSHRINLYSAMLVLGYSFVEAAGSSESKKIITLAAHRNKQGISGGIFGLTNLNSHFFKKASQIFGNATQPFTGDSASSGVGIFIANSLLGQLNSPLYMARYLNQKGLAATFIPSSQLQLV